LPAPFARFSRLLELNADEGDAWRWLGSVYAPGPGLVGSTNLWRHCIVSRTAVPKEKAGAASPAETALGEDHDDMFDEFASEPRGRRALPLTVAGLAGSSWPTKCAPHGRNDCASPGSGSVAATIPPHELLLPGRSLGTVARRAFSAVTCREQSPTLGGNSLPTRPGRCRSGALGASNSHIFEFTVHLCNVFHSMAAALSTLGLLILKSKSPSHLKIWTQFVPVRACTQSANTLASESHTPAPPRRPVVSLRGRAARCRCPLLPPRAAARPLCFQSHATCHRLGTLNGPYRIGLVVLADLCVAPAARASCQPLATRCTLGLAGVGWNAQGGFRRSCSVGIRPRSGLLQRVRHVAMTHAGLE
jgi:hypothetical protein